MKNQNAEVNNITCLTCGFNCCNSCGRRVCLCKIHMRDLPEHNELVRNWGVAKIVVIPEEEKVTEAPKLAEWKGEWGLCPYCGGVKYYCPHFTKIK